MTPEAITRQVVELGRQPNEPTFVIPVSKGRSLTSWMFGKDAKRPLADPRLEVLRALSSALDKAPEKIDPSLFDAARRTGWKLADLQLFFPSFAWGRIAALTPTGAAA